MVSSLALIALLLTAIPADPDPPADQSPPYTVEGVRRAASSTAAPAKQAEAREQPDPPPSPAQTPRRRLADSAPQQMQLDTWAPPKPVFRLPDDDRLVTPSLAARGPAWHQEFLAMTTPTLSSSPFEMMGNGERAQALASSMAFALAIDGATRLAQHLAKSYSQGKVNRLRRQIDEETAIVEREYKARLAREGVQVGATAETGDKNPKKDRAPGKKKDEKKEEKKGG